MNHSTQRLEARALVVEAFEETPYPGDAALPREGTAYWTAIYGEKYEGAEVFRLFRGKRWQEVDLTLLRHPAGGFHQGALAFLSAEAVGYYAPALMIIALDHGNDADLFMDDAIDIFGSEFSLKPGSLERRIGNYTDGQKSAVAAFLQVMADEEFEGDPESRPAILLRERWNRHP